MNWVLLLMAATGVLAGPVVAGVVLPGLLTDVAQQGLSVNHRHFVFNEQFPLQTGDRVWDIYLYDGDLYEMPLTSQAILRGAIVPAPSDAELREAFQKIAERYHLPVLSYDVERKGSEVVIKATLPAGIAANLSPKYRDLVAKYEA